MGKTGIIKILAGSVESRVRADRTATFGRLKDLSRGRIDGMIDSLVNDGFLFRDMDHEYKIITLTDRGAHAGDGDLAAYETKASPARSASSGAASRSSGQTGSGDDDLQLDPAGEALLLRLQEWRSRRASADGMPSYVIAHNKDLVALAAIRPGSEAALGSVPGFGPSRVAKYGDELLALIAEDDS
jgi:ATP-dependent DNA helicase RecQ